MPLHPDFAQTLEALVEKADGSQEEIASALGVTRATLYNWQKGKRRPRREDAQKAANYFRLPVSTFWLEELSPSDATKLVARYERFIAEVENLLDELHGEEARDMLAERVDAPQRQRRPGA